MASVLASQLQALRVASGGVSTHSKPSTRPSLLFHPSQAADIDLVTIFTLSQTGLDELVAMDGRFRAFKNTLFSLESSRLDREFQSKEFNGKLNKSIATFLRLLSGYIMLTSAHQTLEYLIRRHKIHVYNVEEVVLCVIPFHESSFFVRMVQLLEIKNTRWQFLEAVQSTGAAPPRGVLVQRCTYDMAVLEAICESAMAVAGTGAKSKAAISFTAVLILETLSEVSVVSTELVNRILPSILRSFENGISEEYRVGALMIIGALVNRTTLAQKLVETLFNHLSRAFERGSDNDDISVHRLYIMVMIQLAQTQQMNALPKQTCKTLVKVRDFIPVLADLAKDFNAQKFITLNLQALIELCVQHENYEHALLYAIKSLPVEGQIVPSVLRLLEIVFDKGATEERQEEVSKSRNVVTTLLQAIEKRFPVELDKAISLYFQQSTEVNRSKNKKEDPVFIFLSDVFEGSLRAPMEETHTSLYLSLDHPQAPIRVAAVKQLSKLAARVDPGKELEIYAVLREAYLRRLSDDDYPVILSVLSVQDLVKVLPAERLFQALVSIVSKCRAVLLAGEMSSQGDLKKTSKRVMELLAADFIVQNPGYVNEVAVVLFDHLFQRPMTWRLNKLALKAAGTLPFHLFTDLTRVYAEIPSGTDEEGTKPKVKRKSWQADTNRNIIKSLVLRLADDPATLLPLLLNCNLSGNSKVLVALVLVQYLRQHFQDVSSTLVDASLRWIRDEWTNEGLEKSFPVADLILTDYTEWYDSNVIPAKFYTQLDVNLSAAYMELLLRALHSLVTCLTSQQVTKLKGDEEEQESLDELFVLFAGSSSMKIFAPHIDLLLSQLPVSQRFRFLSKFYMAEGSAVPVLVKVHSLDVLASQLQSISGSMAKDVDDNTYAHLQFTLPPLIVALSSPLKAVRRSASSCVEHLSTVWNKQTLGKERDCKQLGIPLLPAKSFGKILQVLVDAKATVISSGTYVEELFREKYGPSQSYVEDDVKLRDGGDQNTIIAFFAHQAFCLTVYGQRMLFKVLQGMAHGTELVCATHERLTAFMERRKLAHLHFSLDGISKQLSQADVQLLEVWIQMYTRRVALKCSKSPDLDEALLSPLFECLKIEGGSLVDPAVLQPCLAALKCLTPDFYTALYTPWQNIVFQALITLSTANSESVRSTSHGVLRNVVISASTIVRHLQLLMEEGFQTENIERKRKKRRALVEEKHVVLNKWPVRGKLLSSTTTILDLLVWKSDMEERQVLITPLLKLLRSILDQAWPRVEIDEEVLTNGSEGKKENPQAGVLLNMHHLILMVLNSIVRYLTAAVVENKDFLNQVEFDVGTSFDVDTVVDAVNSAPDEMTRNHALALLASLGKLIPDAILKRLISVLSVVGESTLTQDDSHSHEVVYHMLTAIVPSWLAVEKDPTALLQVFVNALPRIPVHRRMAAITKVLRVTTEEEGLHIFLSLLLQKASSVQQNETATLEFTQPSRGSKENVLKSLKSLELDFATSLCRQYSPGVILPAMVKLLALSKVDIELYSSSSSSDAIFRESAYALQQLATEFVADQLQVSELHTGVKLIPSSETLQESFVALMEQVLLQLQSVSHTSSLSQNRRKSVQRAAVSLLHRLTLVMNSTEYIKGIISLMKHSDTHIQRKVLKMYASKLKEMDKSGPTGGPRRKQVDVLSLVRVDLGAEELDLQMGMVKDITSLLSVDGEEVSTSTKVAAIEALSVSAQRYAEKMPDTFTSALSSLVTNFQTKNRALSAAAVQCVATILTQLGPQALPALPGTVSTLLEAADEALAAVPDTGAKEDNDGVERSNLVLAILQALEVMVDKMGAFLSPYLQRIFGLIFLRPELMANSNASIVTKAAAVRSLLPTRIPIRLLLDPLMSTYGGVIKAGVNSTCALFEILAATTAKADRAAVAVYHGRIFEFCLTAFDLRGQALDTLPSLSRVETAVVSAVVSLVMKLSETTFRPLFVKILEWAESEMEVEEGSLVSQSVNRNIIFYKLVNQLALKLRSVFVPYLRYLINGCVHHLNGGLLAGEEVKPRKKKKKQSSSENQGAPLTLSGWHLRQLILSALHKCFLYDTGGFLDAQKFELLLPPIIAQFTVEVPSEVPLLEAEPQGVEGPSLQEMDDALVSCVGQMALTAGDDTLWKPLNHKVLMCTRNEDVRIRLLGLRVVKFLVEHLKEEYLVFLPETIPFLAELLEDSDLPVVAKTQEIVKFLEDLSGEDLTQYF